MEDKKSPCTPDAKAISYPLVSPPLTTRVQMPMPREFNGEKYYGTADVAKIMGVTQQTVSRWQNELYMGAPLFTADERAHDGRYLYKVERVMQLKEIYHPDWKRGGYQTSPTCTGQEAVISQQERIAEAVKFFDFLYDRVPTPTFIYLAKFKDKREFPAFSATDAKQRAAMAVKAIELNDSSVDIWHSVNPVSVKPTFGKRGDESAVAYQVAIVTDIDIRSDAHKSENLAADFDEAKSFLPFAPTILIHSGYGIQAYYVFETPIKITDENREECKRRNELFLDVIRARANGKTIDAVGDLPRILRTPGTFNYKLGTLNAPLCHIVDFSDVRFTPAEIDEKLAALPIPATPSKPVDVDKSARNHREIIDDSDFDIYRARRMLDFINPANLTYDEWFAVGAALKNVGCSCSDWEQWSKNEDRFKDGECEYKWDTFDRDGYGIGTLYNFAAPNGYDAKEIYREYADLHPDFARKRADRADVFDKFNTDRLQSVRKTTTNDAEPIGISDSTSPKAKRQERADRMNDLMTTREVADFLDVSPKTVASWRTRKLFGVPFFSADEKHGNTWYYKRERVEQLKSVYQFGILQNMYKLARRNPESYAPSFFSENCYSNMTSTLGARKIKLDGVIEVDEDEYQKLAEAEDENYARRYFKYYKDYFSVDEVANYFGVQENTVIQWNKRGQLKWDMLDHDGEMFFKAEKIFEFTPPKERKTKPDRADVYSSPAPMHDDQTTDDGEITTKYYVKDCPVALTIPANFEFKNRGITQLVPDKKKPDEPKRVITTRTPIIPTKILREAKSGTVQYEIAIKSGDTWRKAIVSGRTINDSRAIIDLADYGALVEYPAALKSFFNSIIATNLNNGRLTSSKVYKMPGWYDGKFVYPQSTGDKIVMRDGIDYDSLFAVKGSQDAWRDKFIETCFKATPCKNIIYSQFIVGSALLAPALEVLGIPNTQVHLWGSRNFAKSPILKLAVSIYGNPTEGKLFRNFASTAKNRMTLAAGLCDLPLAVDELEAADKFDDLQGDIYKYFGGTINQANKRDGRTREAEYFRGVRLLTGEHAVIELDTAKGGALKRLIQLQARTPLLPEDKAHELHLFLADNYGHYGRDWTKYIAEHRLQMKESFAILKDKLANDVDTPNCEKTHGRAVLAAFFCLALFSIMIKNDSTCTSDEGILMRTRMILRELPTLDEIDVAKRAAAYLSSYVDEHPRKFLSDSATYYEAVDERRQRPEELDGIKYHDGKIAFFANAFKRVIAKSGLPAYSSVLAELYEAGYLIAKSSRDKSSLVYHPITTSRARVYLFKEEIIATTDKEDKEAYEID